MSRLGHTGLSDKIQNHIRGLAGATGNLLLILNFRRFTHSPFRLTNISYGVIEKYYAKKASYEIPD
jgi:hypothetical protein